MKTLTKHVIIYDDECPLCDLYTGGFVKSGMLDQCGRTPFSTLDPKIGQLIDRRRACNEIALVNKEDGRVMYGTQSLFEIIGHSFPFLKPLFRFRPFAFFINMLYSFISYNRKVIIPGKVFESKASCVPDYNPKYRWAFVIAGSMVTAVVLNIYSTLLGAFVPVTTISRELAICMGQVVFQGAVVGLLSKERVLHYLGNMMTVSLMGALLLIPVLVINKLISINGFVNLGLFGMVVGLMFLEHWRRVKILEIHWFVSLSWVLYRLLVLWIIL